MSGGEVLGLISAIIGIIDATTKVYAGLKDAQSLPEAFGKVADRLPLVNATLRAIENKFTGNADEKALLEIQAVVESCKIRAGHLQEIFEAVIPPEGAKWREKYRAVIQRICKGTLVEVVTKDMMEDVRLLAANQAVQGATQDQVVQLEKAIKELTDMEPSLPNDDPFINQHHTGSGHNIGHDNIGVQNNHQGGGSPSYGATYNYGLYDRANDIDGAAVGTCEWLFQNPTYEEWLRLPTNLLEIKGKPGSGKSTLMQYAVQHVTSKFSTDEGALVISFFFHRRGSELQRTPLGLFRSLLYQLLRQDSGALTDFVAIFRQQFEIMGKPGNDYQWHQNELQHFFESSLLKILETRTVWLFIDGLDEFGREKAIKLAKNFEFLLQKSQSIGLAKLRICFTCRHYPGLEFGRKSTISLDSQTTKDITTFVTGQLSDGQLYDDFGDLIIKGSQGVFMWAFLVLKTVRQMIDAGQSTVKIKRQITRGSEDFNMLYRGIIEPVKDHPATMKLMQWICFSMRPLTLDEIRWAMIVDPDCTSKSLNKYELSEDFITPDKVELRIKALSCGLAEVFPLGNARTVQFIHPSVKDFLVKDELMTPSRIQAHANLVAPTAHLILSRCCIRYLQMAISSRSAFLTQDEMSRYPFLHYATTSWTFHAQLGETAETSRGGLLGLLRQCPEFIESWVKIYQRMEPFSRDCPSTGSHLIHVAARYGLKKLLHQLLLDGNEVDVDLKDEDEQTPLSWAARNGHKASVELLLKTENVKVDTRDKNGLTPLSWSARNGQKEVVKLLLKTKRVKINSKDRNGQTPLSWSARNGHKEVVKKLLRTKDVDIDATDNFNWTPLSQATWNGHKRVVELLISTGKVDVDVTDTVYGQTPLSWAASNGHEAVASLLLSTNKVDINARDKNGRTSLLRATEEGQNDMVKLLLSTNEADINAKDETGQSPLTHAAENGSEAVVSMLVEKGADLEVENSNTNTPLLLAAIQGNENVVLLLLQQGADFDVKNEYGDTPLLCAAYNGHEATARMLLDKGANIEATNDHGDTPLLWALYHGHEDVVRLLLEQGADFNVKNQRGETPLMWAVYNGHETVARLLLERGAEIETKNEHGETPLSWAIYEGQEVMVRLLLGKGAKLEVENMDGNTPLLSAVYHGQEAPVEGAAD